MVLPLEVNDLIKVRTAASESLESFESRVEEVSSGEILIHWPNVAGDSIPVSENQVLIVSFSHNRRAYEFDARILRVIPDPVWRLAIRPTGLLRSIQRREDVRIRVIAPVELIARVVGMARYKDARSRPHRIKGETISLSAGGFSIHHQVPIAVGTLFEVKLTLSGESQKPLETSASVIHCTGVGPLDARPVMFELGFEFRRISELNRARIVRYVFSAQREERLDE